MMSMAKTTILVWSFYQRRVALFGAAAVWLFGFFVLVMLL